MPVNYDICVYQNYEQAWNECLWLSENNIAPILYVNSTYASDAVLIQARPVQQLKHLPRNVSSVFFFSDIGQTKVWSSISLHLPKNLQPTSGRGQCQNIYKQRQCWADDHPTLPSPPCEAGPGLQQPRGRVAASVTGAFCAAESLRDWWQRINACSAIRAAFSVCLVLSEPGFSADQHTYYSRRQYDAQGKRQRCGPCSVTVLWFVRVWSQYRSQFSPRLCFA